MSILRRVRWQESVLSIKIIAMTIVAGSGAGSTLNMITMTIIVKILAEGGQQNLR